MNCHRFQHVSLFILIFLLATPRLLADSVDDYIREQMNARHIPGLVLLVLRNGKLIKQQSYGLANVELGVPTSKDSVFPLASVTKVFTATAVYCSCRKASFAWAIKSRNSCRDSQMPGTKLLS
jgi:CubicO group peptidase (beta-lactamase class C family)